MQTRIMQTRMQGEAARGHLLQRRALLQGMARTATALQLLLLLLVQVPALELAPVLVAVLKPVLVLVRTVRTVPRMGATAVVWPSPSSRMSCAYRCPRCV